MPYFPNEDKKQWEEKCSDYGEEFIGFKGGAQCQSSCSFKKLEEEP